MTQEKWIVQRHNRAVRKAEVLGRSDMFAAAKVVAQNHVGTDGKWESPTKAHMSNGDIVTITKTVIDVPGLVLDQYVPPDCFQCDVQMEITKVEPTVLPNVHIAHLQCPRCKATKERAIPPSQIFETEGETR